MARRRVVLGSAATFLLPSLAGCGTLDDDEPADVAVHNADEVRHAVAVTVTATDDGEVLLDGSVTLAPDEWKAWADSLPAPDASPGVEAFRAAVRVDGDRRREREVRNTARFAVLQIEVGPDGVTFQKLEE